MSWTPTHKWIVRNGNAETFGEEQMAEFSRYISQESSVNATTACGSSLLHYAALTSLAHKLIPFLIECGADVNYVDNNGATPLHWAARNPSKLAVKCLLKHGACPKAFDNDHNTPLHYAAECGNVSTAKQLLRWHPASLNVRNFRLQSPLNLACEGEMTKMIRFLLSRGARFEEPMIQVAVRNNSPRVIKSLLQNVSYEKWARENMEVLVELAEQEKSRRALRALRSLRV